MAEKRKDSNKRVLYSGESQRKDGRYMYRYTDIFGVRQCIYAPTLAELRQKEQKIKKDLEDGIVVSGGKITVSELLDNYLKSNPKWKDSTRAMKVYNVNKLKTYPLSQMKIKDVRVSHVKQLMISMNESGIKKSSLRTYLNILKLAIQIAVDDDLIRKNPCNISLNFLPNENLDKNILTEEQEAKFLKYIKETSKSDWLYDVLIILLETGLRIGELCGLTLDNIDLKNRVIHIDHQLGKNYNEKSELWQITSTKTGTSIRDIYITDRAYNSFLNLIERRSKNTTVEPIINGYTKFLLTSNKKWRIVTNSMVRYELNSAITKYNKEHKEQIPHLSPHSLRHTFCTRMAEKGLSSSSLQYIMGHAKIATTMDIYTHWSGSLAINEMERISQIE